MWRVVTLSGYERWAGRVALLSRMWCASRCLTQYPGGNREKIIEGALQPKMRNGREMKEFARVCRATFIYAPGNPCVVRDKVLSIVRASQQGRKKQVR